MSCIPYNEARFRVKSESGTRHDPVKVEESDDDELVDDDEMLEEESDLTDIDESPPVAEDTAEVDEPAEEEDGPARRTRSAQESPQPVKKRKRKSGFSYRQPTITPLPNIRQSDFYKKCCAEVESKISPTMSEGHLYQIKTLRAKLSNPTSDWGMVEEESLSQKRGGNSEGGPCEGCNEAGIECYVQIDPHGDERVSQVISRCMGCMAYSTPCDITKPRIAAVKPKKKANLESAIPEKRASRSLRTVKKLAAARKAPTSRSRLSVDIPAAPPKVLKPKPKVEKPKVVKPKVVAVESSDTELVSAVEYISNFTDQLRGMLSKEKEKNFLVQTMFQFMGLKIDVFQKLSKTRSAGSPTVTKEDAESAVQYVQDFSKQAREMLSKGKELDFLVNTMFEAMDMHLGVLRRVAGSL